MSQILQRSIDLLSNEATVYSESGFILLDRNHPAFNLYRNAGAPDRILYQFLSDGGISDNRSANYAQQGVIGRSESYLSYENTNNREVNLTLRFWAVNNIANDVIKPVRWIQSLTLPNTINGRTIPPAPVYVSFGEALTSGNDEYFRAVVQDVSVEWEGPFDLGTMTPYGCEITIQLVGVNNSPESGADYAVSYFDVGAQKNILDLAGIPSIPALDAFNSFSDGVATIQSAIKKLVG